MATYSGILVRNPMDEKAWWSTVHGLQKVRHKLMTEHALRGTNIFRGLLCAMCIISFNLTIILRRGAIICILQRRTQAQSKIKRFRV